MQRPPQILTDNRCGLSYLWMASPWDSRKPYWMGSHHVSQQHTGPWWWTSRHSLYPYVVSRQIGERTLIVTQIKWKFTAAISAIKERCTVLWKHLAGGADPDREGIIAHEDRSKRKTMRQKTPIGAQSITAVFQSLRTAGKRKGRLVWEVPNYGENYWEWMWS